MAEGWRGGDTEKGTERGREGERRGASTDSVPVTVMMWGFVSTPLCVLVCCALHTLPRCCHASVLIWRHSMSGKNGQGFVSRSIGQ
jgi:hypothetical protein